MTFPLLFWARHEKLSSRALFLSLPLLSFSSSSFGPQGVLGIKVKIMLPHDPEGKAGPKKPLPDMVSIMEPKVCISSKKKE